MNRAPHSQGAVQSTDTLGYARLGGIFRPVSDELGILEPSRAFIL